MAAARWRAGVAGVAAALPREVAAGAEVAPVAMAARADWLPVEVAQVALVRVAAEVPRAPSGVAGKRAVPRVGLAGVAGMAAAVALALPGMAAEAAVRAAAAALGRAEVPSPQAVVAG